MPEVQEKIAAAAEFDEARLGPPPTKVARPMRLHPNKQQASAFPDGELAQRTSRIVVRPTSIKVLVYDAAGTPIARYSDPAQALERLSHAKVKLDDVAGGAALVKRVSPPAEEKTPAKKEDKK